MFIKTTKKLVLLSVLILAVAVLTACAQAPVATEVPVAVPTQTCPAPVPCPEIPETVAAPFEELWKSSPHADDTAEAFRHWDEENPAEVPADCATCHSSTGFQDFVGADGSAAFMTDANAPIGSVITCVTCHNEATLTLNTVKFPSGVELTGLGGEATCMTCHQGRASMVQVDEAITKAAVKDEDTISADLGFINIHYFAAAVSRYGTEVKGGYEYAGNTYDTLFEHVSEVQTCTDCHNSHTLQVKIDTCKGCHEVETVEDLRTVREPSSAGDYDGDGNVTEGIYDELEGLKALTLTAIQAYASEVAGAPILYSADAYPYFFADANANGTIDEGEGKYVSWTPRLLKAAYNFQTVTKDPGGFAHGGKYLIQLLHDSIANLNEKLGTPVDLSTAARDDAGHFASNTEAWRHWDAEGEVPGTCAKCHNAEGLPQFIKNGVNIAMEPTSGLYCTTCHNSAEWPALYTMETVTFPSGAKLGFEDAPNANLCLNCHQGRESTSSVDKAIGTLKADEVSENLRFRNVHYFAAGATLFGTDAKGVYEYAGKTYKGVNVHATGFSTCVNCHDPHGLTVKTAACSGCHTTTDPKTIRMTSVADYDGDGDVKEGIAGEIETLAEKLYAAIVAKSGAAPLVYSASAYPYWFADANANGAIDDGEEGYAAWTPRLLKAAYNYQYVQKDPGAFAHNGIYIMQVLYDSIQDVGGSTTGLVRP